MRDKGGRESKNPKNLRDVVYGWSLVAPVDDPARRPQREGLGHARLRLDARRVGAGAAGGVGQPGRHVGDALQRVERGRHLAQTVPHHVLL